MMNEEINKFNKLALDWWDLQGPMKPLHQLNPLRFQFITGQIELAGKQVLDVGCGGGILTESLARAGAVTMGIDLAPDLITIAKAHADPQLLQIDYQCIAVEDLAQQYPQRFDVITCMELLEHVPSPPAIIASCTQLLKPGGMLFLATLNRNVKSFLLAIVGAEYIMNLVPKGTHEYAKFIKPAELSRMLRDAALEVEQLRGINYNPITQTFKLSNDCAVNYLLSAHLN